MALPPPPGQLQHTTRLIGRTNVAASPPRASRKDPAAADSLFGYSPGPPPEQNQLTRDVWRWVQRLDLSIPIRNPRRDCANGYLVAELLGKIYEGEHSYQNGTSEPVKRDNWERVVRLAEKHELQLPAALVDGTMRSAPGAAAALLERLYEQLTGKKVQRLDASLQLAAAGLHSTSASSAAAAAAALATAPAVHREPAPVSFGEPAAPADSGALRAIKAAGSASPGPEFGAVQTQEAGRAADVRRRFAAGRQQG